MWEIINATPPWDDISPLEAAVELINNNTLPPIPDCDHAFQAIMAQCWQREPSDRPDFKTICQFYREIEMEQKKPEYLPNEQYQDAEQYLPQSTLQSPKSNKDYSLASFYDIMNKDLVLAFAEESSDEEGSELQMAKDSTYL